VKLAGRRVVDRRGCMAGLERGQIARAGLDVCGQEPQGPAALWQCDKVVITPHIASNTPETMAALADLVFENMQAFAAGKSLLTPVI
ncbi:MAG TPA: hydroxyacid dehydrogenase, partial [Pantoea sp.]|nr:hydroxyacid dehydrogenase [Pantoea sp.]